VEVVWFCVARHRQSWDPRRRPLLPARRPRSRYPRRSLGGVAIGRRHPAGHGRRLVAPVRCARSV